MTKKHVVLIVGLVLIAAIALINGLLFRVKTVTVDFDTETSIQAEEGEAEKIIAASGIKKGKNIFGVSESRMIKNINVFSKREYRKDFPQPHRDSRFEKGAGLSHEISAEHFGRREVRRG